MTELGRVLEVVGVLAVLAGTAWGFLFVLAIDLSRHDLARGVLDYRQRMLEKIEDAVSAKKKEEEDFRARVRARALDALVRAATGIGQRPGGSKR
jgi:hypothetical protein